MKVKIGGNYSETQNISSIVTQKLIFINDLPNGIKSEIEIFVDDIKLVVRPLSKETTQMDQKKLSYWESIWKLRINIEKCYVLHIVSQKIKVEYELSKKEIKK